MKEQDGQENGMLGEEHMEQEDDMHKEEDYEGYQAGDEEHMGWKFSNLHFHLFFFFLFVTFI